MHRFALSFMFVVVASLPARAEPSSLRLDVGLFSPTGEVGVVYSRPVHERLALELGGGLGMSGVQLSAMGKLRIGNARTKLTPGIGISVGVPVGDLSALRTEHDGPPITSLWLDVDVLGVEYRTQGGWVLSASVGVTLPLTRSHWDVIDLGGTLEPLHPVPQFRIGLGKTF